MKNSNDAKKVVLLLTIGLCEALRAKTISITEAEHLLFSPRTMRLFDDDDEVSNIIHHSIVYNYYKNDVISRNSKNLGLASFDYFKKLTSLI